MRHIKLIFILLTVILFTVTCKKEHVTTPVTTTPVFYFNGMVEGVSTSLNAGVNNYYMYSSYTQDTNHVYNFIGDLKQTTSNLNSIQIQINDYKVSVVNGNTQIDSSLNLGNYSYYSVGATDTTYNVQFTSSYTNGTAQTYTWSFGDGTTSNLANPTHTYNNLGIYNVCLNINGSAGSSNLCNNIYISSPAVTAKKAIISSSSVGTNISFTDSVTFTPYACRWNFGDGGADSTVNTPGTTTTLNHTYGMAGLYHVSLTVLFNGGTDSIITNYNAATATYTVGTADFKVNSITPVITIGSTLRLSNVIVNWTDANGIFYTSDNSSQPATSTFRILSEEAYQNNINGQLTRKLHVNFSCTLYSSGHPSIQITNADAVIAIAYK